MQILDYNRAVKDLNGLAPRGISEKLDDSFSVQSEDAAVKPAHVGEFGMYLKGRWYRLTNPPGARPTQ